MAKGFGRYGFATSRRPLQMPVDPLARATTSALFERTYGTTLIDRIDDAIDAGVCAQQPALFMVVGANGGGRTSITNFILSRFAARLDIAPANLIVPVGTTTNHDKLYIYRYWMSALEDAIAARSIALTPALQARFTAEIQKNDIGIMAPGYRGVLRQLTEVLRQHPQPHAFACRLENVPTIDFVAAANEIFDGMPSTCVFTALDNSTHETEVVGPFREYFSKKQENCCLVELARPQGEIAARMITERWAIESSAPLPFSDGSLARGFDREPRPIGKILVLVEQMLKYKFTQHGEGPPYPDSPELAFSAQEIEGLIAAVDLVND